ncbi:ROK family protein [Roseibium sediminicola]|uniref:ROK family protein n=1 Tax=Roseibium sediminicola TaxID=2933272 RepID=A0ABT0GY07_9HYPH|nr:ROK family protein [Roseibium sp. CAU 1639]MCK7613947.1 ROK family protein [Roseibium sp. CAU 1639]
MRMGIDWGGTKMEIIALSEQGMVRFRKRVATPKGDYDGCLRAVAALVADAEAATGKTGTLGVGLPGSLSPATGLVKNSNATWLNGKPLDRDLQSLLGRPVRIQNDANCFAVSEATDGAGAGKAVVHAIIIGTGCGSGIAINGKAHSGANGIAGEWGAITVPWMTAEEYPGPDCWIGHRGTLEYWCSGTGFQADYQKSTGTGLKGPDIIALKRQGDPLATEFYQAYVSRLGRALALSANLLDPDVLVLGGGMSNVDELYEDLPAAMAPYIFSDTYDTPILKAVHGDSSGVRGAAWLWKPDEI